MRIYFCDWVLIVKPLSEIGIGQVYEVLKRRYLELPMFITRALGEKI